MSQKEREQLHAEFSILSSLRHPNIVAYYHREHLKATQELHLYMEYCGGGDLSQVIQGLLAKNQFAEEEFVWSIFAQLVTALYRCHYGVDPPEVGKNIMGPTGSSRPTGLRTKNQVMILHRDLKPENGMLLATPFFTGHVLIAVVFLGEDNSVKLGDFGLSKLMQSHDFASTYVGTPFYMSPEICAAERYTQSSDIWSLGCIIYELCSRQPPFIAKTHFHLVQKIKEGRVDSLPSMYSPELQSVIKSCLKTHPSARPDAAALLQLPMVRLMRKEKEVVELGRGLKLKEEHALQAANEMRLRVSALESERENIRAEVESTVRREWEVKARLEIDRQVQMEFDKLQKKFNSEVESKAAAEAQRRFEALQEERDKDSVQRSDSPTDIPFSSVSTNNNTDSDFQASTDMSSLSLESPLAENSNPGQPRKSGRTPFTRARTQYDSPMDVQMAEPSPMSIASLSLSPRRTAIDTTKRTNAVNIFAAAEQKAKWQPQNLEDLPSEDDGDLEEEDDELPDLPSPIPSSKATAAGDPFKMPARPIRPGMLRQKTAPMQPRLQTQPALFTVHTNPSTDTLTSKEKTSPSSQEPLRGPGMPISPPRRLSKAPPTVADVGSPVRRAPRPPLNNLKAKGGPGGEEMLKVVMSRNILGNNQTEGRTLIELAQAKAGIVGVSSYPPIKVGKGDENAVTRIVSMREENSRGEEIPTWDPERDEMPSPFIVRGRKVGLGVGMGADLRQ